MHHFPSTMIHESLCFVYTALHKHSFRCIHISSYFSMQPIASHIANPPSPSYTPLMHLCSVFLHSLANHIGLICCCELSKENLIQPGNRVRSGDVLSMVSYFVRSLKGPTEQWQYVRVQTS